MRALMLILLLAFLAPRLPAGDLAHAFGCAQNSSQHALSDADHHVVSVAETDHAAHQQMHAEDRHHAVDAGEATGDTTRLLATDSDDCDHCGSCHDHCSPGVMNAAVLAAMAAPSRPADTAGTHLLLGHHDRLQRPPRNA